MSSAKVRPAPRALVGEVISPTPMHAHKINLSKLSAIRVEMAKVYRESRARKLDTGEATKLVYILSQIGKMYELEVIESRIAALERSDRR